MRDPVPGRIAIYLRSATVRCLLATRGIGGTYRWIQRRTRRRLGPSGAQQDAESLARRIADAVTGVNDSYAVRHVPCLEESLCLWWTVRSAGLAADLRLGVRTVTGRFESHAWVEYRGAVLNDAPDVARVYPPIEGAAGGFEAFRE